MCLVLISCSISFIPYAVIFHFESQNVIRIKYHTILSGCLSKNRFLAYPWPRYKPLIQSIRTIVFAHIHLVGVKLWIITRQSQSIRRTTKISLFSFLESHYQQNITEISQVPASISSSDYRRCRCRCRRPCRRRRRTLFSNTSYLPLLEPLHHYRHHSATTISLLHRLFVPFLCAPLVKGNANASQTRTQVGSHACFSTRVRMKLIRSVYISFDTFLLPCSFWDHFDLNSTIGIGSCEHPFARIHPYTALLGKLQVWTPTHKTESTRNRIHKAFHTIGTIRFKISVFCFWCASNSLDTFLVLHRCFDGVYASLPYLIAPYVCYCCCCCGPSTSLSTIFCDIYHLVLSVFPYSDCRSRDNLLKLRIDEQFWLSAQSNPIYYDTFILMTWQCSHICGSIYLLTCSRSRRPTFNPQMLLVSHPYRYPCSTDQMS